MNEQISFFEMMGLDDTPTIPFEKQKEGVKGWIIEIMGIFTVENGFDRNMVGVTTSRVILKADSYVRKDNKISQHAECTGEGGGCKGDGWIGFAQTLYTKRPKWRELQDYVRRNYKGTYDEIVYTYKDGHAMLHTGEYPGN